MPEQLRVHEGEAEREKRLWRNFLGYNERRVIKNVKEILRQRALGQHKGRTVGEVFMERGSARALLQGDVWREAIVRAQAVDGDDAEALGKSISDVIFGRLHELCPRLADAERFIREAGDSLEEKRIRLNDLVHCDRDHDDMAMHIHIDQNFSQDYGSREGLARMVRDFTDAMKVLAKKLHDVPDKRFEDVAEVRGTSPLVVSTARLLEREGWTVKRDASGNVVTDKGSGRMAMSIEKFLETYLR